MHEDFTHLRATRNGRSRDEFTKRTSALNTGVSVRKTTVTTHLYVRIVSLADSTSTGDRTSNREYLSELVARCDDHTIVDIVDDLLWSKTIPAPRPLREPQIGTIQLQVREPICRERFILADALVTIAEVMVDESLGWAMRVGANAEAAVAAAVLDGWLAGADGDDAAKKKTIDELKSLDRVHDYAINLRRREVLATAIEFEELD